MTPEQLRAIHETLLRHMYNTRRAYYRGTPGIRYQDMAAAAERVLSWRRTMEQATGRPITTQVSKEAIATLLRA